MDIRTHISRSCLKELVFIHGGGSRFGGGGHRRGSHVARLFKNMRLRARVLERVK